MANTERYDQLDELEMSEYPILEVESDLMKEGRRGHRPSEKHRLPTVVVLGTA